MSVSMTEEEHTMTTEGDQLAPEFAIAMRGYDRMQVDEYVSQLNAWMAEAEARQSIAESFVADRDRHIEQLERRVRELESERTAATPAAALDDAGRQIAASLDAVVSTCNELHSQAQARCDEILEEARRDALAVVSAARTTVSELEEVAKNDRIVAASSLNEARIEAEQDAAAIRADANEYKASVRAEVEALRAEHQRVLDQLTDLRGSLEGLISAPAAVLAAVDDITGHRDETPSPNGRGSR
jgi:cell division septum initiation protein DivIVA